MTNRVTLATVLLLSGSLAAAGERGEASTTVGGKTVSIDYGRPSLKGRPLAELLGKLPSDRVWRAGDDQVTILKTETALTLGGTTVPAGKYSVYVHAPTDGPRSLILNKDQGQPLKNLWKEAPADKAELPWPYLQGYETSIKGSEVARVPMKKEETKKPVDPFTVSWAPSKKGAMLNLAWGEEAWSVEVEPGKAK
jgi:hypothetical protein